jgi:hypothetical protein
MHFHYLSFLLGFISEIVFVCSMVYLILRSAYKSDEQVFRIQKSVDDFVKQDSDSRNECD